MYRNKQWLKKKYFDERLLMREIAIICGVQRETIARWFKKFRFKGRSPSQRHMGKWNGKWQGGRYVCHQEKGRYVFIIRKNGKPIREHRFVMEQQLGRKLSSQETVHHLDGNSLNNNPKNLIFFPSKTEHQRYEDTLNTLAKQILFGKHKPSNHKELLSLFNKLLSKNGQDIST